MKVTGQKIVQQTSSKNTNNSEKGKKDDLKHQTEDKSTNASSTKKTSSTKASSRYAPSNGGAASKDHSDKTVLSSTADQTNPMEANSDYS